MSRATTLPRTRWVACLRCGLPVEHDPRRSPQMCRDCKDADNRLYREWKTR